MGTDYRQMPFDTDIYFNLSFGTGANGNDVSDYFHGKVMSRLMDDIVLVG